MTDPKDAVVHLILPVATLSLTGIAVLARQTRSGLVEVMRQDYIRTARAKGLGETGVILRHGMKNSMLPVLTVIGFQVATLFGGSVLIERVFAIPGLGRLAYDATYNHDYPVLQGLVFLVTLTVIAVNLLTDIAYAALDPRIRL